MAQTRKSRAPSSNTAAVISEAPTSPALDSIAVVVPVGIDNTAVVDLLPHTPDTGIMPPFAPALDSSGTTSGFFGPQRSSFQEHSSALVTLNDCSENFDTASLPVDEAVSGQQNATVSNPASSIPGVTAIGSPPATLRDTEDMPIPSLQVDKSTACGAAPHEPNRWEHESNQISKMRLELDKHKLELRAARLKATLAEQKVNRRNVVSREETHEKIQMLLNHMLDDIVPILKKGIFETKSGSKKRSFEEYQKDCVDELFELTRATRNAIYKVRQEFHAKVGTVW
ncbi:hypothetical protein DL98DRAFT_578803 [Cadophora sp. DSE1049]|nr:hypothetical protein DL98DRAFT_578803 [Cadophora sp. DSE1049]